MGEGIIILVGHMARVKRQQCSSRADGKDAQRQLHETVSIFQGCDAAHSQEGSHQAICNEIYFADSYPDHGGDKALPHRFQSSSFKGEDDFEAIANLPHIWKVDQGLQASAHKHSPSCPIDQPRTIRLIDKPRDEDGGDHAHVQKSRGKPGHKEIVMRIENGDQRGRQPDKEEVGQHNAGEIDGKAHGCRLQAGIEQSHDIRRQKHAQQGQDNQEEAQDGYHLQGKIHLAFLAFLDADLVV